MHKDLRPAEPPTYGKHGLAQKRERRPGRIQAPKPSTQRGRVGHAIRIFDRGRRSFPATAFEEIAPERLAAGDQAVVAVGRREQRQESERHPTQLAKAAANPNPIMIFVMRLFAAAAMTDEGVLGTKRASAQDDSRTRQCPIGSEVVLRGRKWDKQNRSDGGSAYGIDLAEIGVRSGAFALQTKSQLEKNNALRWPLSGWATGV